MNKFLYILTIFFALIMTNCDERLRVEKRPIHPESTTEEVRLRQKLCPPCNCKPCLADACSEDEKSNPWNTKCYYAGKATNDDNPLPPRDFGNGIYFFPLIQHRFAKSLSMFLKSHPELRVNTIAEDSISERKGYFVVFEPKTNNGKTEGEEK